MAAVSTILVFDSGLRGAAAVLLLLIGGSLVRDHGKSPAARLGAAFAIGVAAYVFCSAPGFSDHRELWQAPILGLCSGNVVIFWLFTRAMFDDSFKHRWWHTAIWILLVGSGLLRLFVWAPAGSSLSEPVGIALSLTSADSPCSLLHNRLRAGGRTWSKGDAGCDLSWSAAWLHT